jgi:hypothetical protein
VSDIARVTKLAALLVEQQAKVKQLDEDLKAAKKAMLATEREDLPMLMKEVCLSEIKLESGEKISVVEDCDAAITEKTRSGAIRWLVKNDFGGLIKTQVAVEFARGDHDAATEVRDQLAETYDGVQLVEKVHPATLKAFVKEQLGKGANVPMDLFNVRPYSKVKVSKK